MLGKIHHFYFCIEIDELSIFQIIRQMGWASDRDILS